jgi:hypothetical protein
LLPVKYITNRPEAGRLKSFQYAGDLLLEKHGEMNKKVTMRVKMSFSKNKSPSKMSFSKKMSSKKVIFEELVFKNEIIPDYERQGSPYHKGPGPQKIVLAIKNYCHLTLL